MAVLGWAGAEAIALGCASDSGPGSCGVPEGGGRYFAMIIVSAAVLFGPFPWAAYGRNWQPTLGFASGAPVGIMAALAKGTSQGFVIFAVVLFFFGTMVPWARWRFSLAKQRAASQEG